MYIRIICDNSYTFISNTCFMEWDDTNEVLTIIRANNDKYTQQGAPIEIISTTYDHIQYIIGDYEGDQLDSLSDFGLDSTDIDIVKEFNNSIHNFTPPKNITEYWK